MANTKRAKGTSTKSSPRPVQTGGGGPNWTKIGLWVVGVLLVGGLVWLVASDVAGAPQGSGEAPDGVEFVPVLSADHVTTPVAYDTDPPAGGPHDPQWLRCQVYDEPVRNENAVHALEHGAVWIAYRPDISESELSELTQFGRRAEVIVSPYPGLDSKVVLTSWGTRLEMDTVDADTVIDFIDAFQNQTAPEAGATC